MGEGEGGGCWKGDNWQRFLGVCRCVQLQIIAYGTQMWFIFSFFSSYLIDFYLHHVSSCNCLQSNLNVYQCVTYTSTDLVTSATHRRRLKKNQIKTHTHTKHERKTQIHHWQTKNWSPNYYHYQCHCQSCSTKTRAWDSNCIQTTSNCIPKYIYPSIVHCIFCIYEYIFVFNLCLTVCICLQAMDCQLSANAEHYKAQGSL